MVAEFIRFYGYTAEQALDEFAVRFFALSNSMLQIQADETLTAVMANNANEEVVSKLRTQSRGLPGVVQEVRNVPR